MPATRKGPKGISSSPVFCFVMIQYSDGILANRHAAIKDNTILIGPRRRPQTASSLISPKPMPCNNKATKVKGRLIMKNPKMHSISGFDSIKDKVKEIKRMKRMSRSLIM